MKTQLRVTPKPWSRMFLAAALFNLAFGLPIMLAPRWSYKLAYRPKLEDGEKTEAVTTTAMAMTFWSNFGFAVVLIGGGYYLVSLDATQNRGLVWLGVFAKLFDVIVLTRRYKKGVARPLVLIPAAIDGTFILLFVLFLAKSPKRAATACPVE